LLSKSSERCGSQLCGGIENGTDDFVVAGAAAEVAGQPVARRALEANLKRFQNHSDWSERKKQNPPEPSRVSSE
jgi:hypothetical protein